MSTEQKVAVIRCAPSLGEHRFYSITYTKGGNVTGQSIARYDEIDAWRKDLTEAGWTLAEEVDPESDPSDLLKRAATELRSKAKRATDGPWTCSPVWSPDSTSTSAVYSRAHPTGTVDSEVVACGRIKSGYGGIRNPYNAVWITLMQPAIAEPLALWLDQAASAYDNLVATDCGPAAVLIYAEATNVARAILGEDS